MARMMTPVRRTLACNQLQMVNPRTGKVLGADEETKLTNAALAAWFGAFEEPPYIIRRSCDLETNSL
jgi:hypothetical protein